MGMSGLPKRSKQLSPATASNSSRSGSGSSSASGFYLSASGSAGYEKTSPGRSKGGALARNVLHRSHFGASSHQRSRRQDHWDQCLENKVQGLKQQRDPQIPRSHGYLRKARGRRAVAARSVGVPSGRVLHLHGQRPQARHPLVFCRARRRTHDRPPYLRWISSQVLVRVDTGWMANGVAHGAVAVGANGVDGPHQLARRHEGLATARNLRHRQA